MPAVTAMTVRLARGKHAGPEAGACVMEVASLLEGGRFTDRPASASPVAGALLRSLNDVLGDDERGTLLAFAAQVVGSRGDRALETARATRLLTVLDAALARRPWAARLRGTPRFVAPLDQAGLEHAAMCLVKTDRDTAVALVGELLRTRPPRAAWPMPAERTASPRAGGCVA